MNRAIIVIGILLMVAFIAWRNAQDHAGKEAPTVTDAAEGFNLKLERRRPAREKERGAVVIRVTTIDLREENLEELGLSWLKDSLPALEGPSDDL